MFYFHCISNEATIVTVRVKADLMVSKQAKNWSYFGLVIVGLEIEADLSVRTFLFMVYTRKYWKFWSGRKLAVRSHNQIEITSVKNFKDTTQGKLQVNYGVLNSWPSYRKYQSDTILSSCINTRFHFLSYSFARVVLNSELFRFFMLKWIMQKKLITSNHAWS